MEKKVTLYSIATEMQVLAQEIIEHEGEITPEIEAKLDQLKEAVSGKTDSVAFVIQEAQDRIAITKERIKKETEWLKRAENNLKSFMGYVQGCMEQMGHSEIKGESSRLYIKKGMEVVEVDESKIEEIPNNFVKIKTTVTPDKRLLKEALKLGQSIPGVTLKRNPNKLEVKQLKLIGGK